MRVTPPGGERSDAAALRYRAAPGNRGRVREAVAHLEAPSLAAGADCLTLVLHGRRPRRIKTRVGQPRRAAYEVGFLREGEFSPPLGGSLVPF